MKAFLLTVSLLFALPVLAKEFEIFDGRLYNGLYYPMVDIIEWGEADGNLPHLEVHIHSKEKRIELAGVAGEKNGKPVLWMMYDLRFRGERICRHVIAPAHFKEGMKLYVYRDDSDKDYDNIYFSAQPMTGKKLVPYQAPEYAPCPDELASNKPDARAPASDPYAPAAQASPKVGTVGKDGKNIGVDYDNAAVPFSF